MNSKVNKELDDLCKDFMDLAPNQKKGVLMDAKSLLEVQRHGRALIGNEGFNPLPLKVREIGKG
ncbi:hypothetical protein FACS1894163_05430 [Spirochaetia bacterium]|nr:hypothetical protein FACS1894163_05430 [Spirochaetia bacterium]